MEIMLEQIHVRDFSVMKRMVKNRTKIFYQVIV